jgi:hypothetical protein
MWRLSCGFTRISPYMSLYRSKIDPEIKLNLASRIFNKKIIKFTTELNLVTSICTRCSMAILSGCVFDPFVSIWRNQSLPLEHRYILIAWCVCTWYHVTGRVSCRTHILSLVYKVYWYYSCGTKFSTTTAAIPGLQVTKFSSRYWCYYLRC